MAYEKLPPMAGVDQDIPTAEFDAEVSRRQEALATMSDADLASALEDAYERVRWYLQILVDYLTAAVAEAAKRLRMPAKPSLESATGGRFSADRSRCSHTFSWRQALDDCRFCGEPKPASACTATVEHPDCSRDGDCPVHGRNRPGQCVTVGVWEAEKPGG